MGAMTRRGWAAAAGATALVVGLAGLFVRYAGFVVLAPLDEPFAAACVVWALLLVAVVLYRPSRKQLLIGLLPALALAYLTLGGALVAEVFDPEDGRLVRAVRAGDHEVRVVADVGFLDPEWHVVVRSRRGVLSREWTVKEVEGADPVDVVVTGERSVRVVGRDGAVYDVSF
jgi:hypothetical protein